MLKLSRLSAFIFLVYRHEFSLQNKKVASFWFINFISYILTFVGTFYLNDIYYILIICL